MKNEASVFRFQKKGHKRLFFIAGPCVIESKELCLKIASNLAALSRKYGVDIIFKASYDKANRTSRDSFRGPGPQEGLRVLEQVREKTGLALLTDIHEPSQVKEAAKVVDVLQIPAFLCRQTDLLHTAGLTGKTVNIKKGQFMSPEEMQHALAKAGKNTWITERGTFFGYNRLVVDYAGIPVLKSFGAPVIFDATHSVQMPGAGKGCSLGNRDLVIPLAKAALASGVDGLFFEVHPDPDKALCDGPNSLLLSEFKKQVPVLVEIHEFLNSR
ncbi:MAG: 3-deoxy-8-phosphooctulonate synthase [Fibrobacter sp.]|jgi:2-dehydro-3-deoxyphosphooctonate aldolase (KDO 8-P synthase)|nr:3-deoxy-8-phosphooctulonate synthase [Fibrobacter sp.]